MNDLYRAKQLILEGRCVAISMCKWQYFQQLVGNAMSLRGIFDTDDHGKVIVLHR